MTESYKNKLLKEKSLLLKEMKVIEEEDLDLSPSDFSGENAYADEFSDSASSLFEREKDVSLERNVNDILNQVNDALGRIEEGKFGNCSICDKVIESNRLEAIPYSTLCMSCKEKQEKGY